MSLGGFFKRLGRKTAKYHTKINRVFVPIVSAGAGYFGGAPAAAAVTAIGAQSSYYFRATQARNEGIRGRAARELGRGERKRVAIYGAIGGGAGMLGSFSSSLIAGKGVGNSLVALGLGQAGAELVGAGSILKAEPMARVFGYGLVTPGNLSAQTSSSVPGLVTQSQLNSTLAGGSTSVEAATAAAGKAGGDSLLVKTLGLVTTVAAGKMAGTPGGAPLAGPGGNAYMKGLMDGLMGGGGGGGGGDMGSGGGFMNAQGEAGKLSGTTLAMLGIGALLFLKGG